VIGVNPLSSPSAYWKIVTAGLSSPGAIPKKGISGFGIKNDWEVKKAKGKDGASITKNGKPQKIGSVRFQLWRDGTNPGDPDDFADWDAYRIALQALDEAGAAIDIQHPLINDQGVTSVVINEIHMPEEVAPGMWEAAIDFGEWLPTPKPATGTPSGSAASDGTTANGQGDAGGAPPTSQSAEEKELAETAAEAGL
jgi:hypothetical protein